MTGLTIVPRPAPITRIGDRATCPFQLSPLRAGLLFVSLCWPARANAVDLDFREQIETGRAFAGRGDFAQAETAFRAILKDAQRENQPVWAALALESLGLLYQSLGKPLDAEKMFHNSIDLFTRSEGPQAPDTALVRKDLASLYLSMRQFSRAESLLKESLSILENAPHAELPFADALADLGCINACTRRLEQADLLFHRALEIAENNPAGGEVLIVNYLNYLCFTSILAKRYNDAIQLSERSIQMLNGVTAMPAESRIFAFRVRATAELKRGDLVAAEQWLRRTVITAENVYGRDHPRLGDTLLQYSSVLRKLNRKREAKLIRTRADAILAKQEKTGGYVVDFSELLKP